MKKKVRLSIIIVVYNSAKSIETTIRSVIKHINNPDYEIIVVDNCSSDETIKKVECIGSDHVKLIANSENYGFAKANNIGFSESTGDYILILNPDIEFTNETNIKLLISKLDEEEQNGIIAPKLLYSDGHIQESARSFPNPIVLLIRGLRLESFFVPYAFYREFLLLDKKPGVEIFPDWVIGAFMLLRRATFKRLGGFDEKYFMYYEDADLCHRAKQLGYRTIYTDSISAIHQYQRESAKKLFSKLKYYHIKSIARFLCRLNFQRLFNHKSAGRPVITLNKGGMLNARVPFEKPE